MSDWGRQDAPLDLRAHDLPPRWDGRQVEWSPWTEEPWSTWRFHDDAMGACPRCGSLALRQNSHGLTGGIASLHVSRCTDCRHDTVLEVDTGETWDLDDTDYGDAGSSRPDSTR